jgi:transposase
MTNKLHQNYEITSRDIFWGEPEIYLRVNRCQIKCTCCGKKFRETLEFVNKKRNYTERFKHKIITEVIKSEDYK